MRSILSKIFLGLLCLIYFSSIASFYVLGLVVAAWLVTSCGHPNDEHELADVPECPSRCSIDDCAMRVCDDYPTLKGAL